MANLEELVQRKKRDAKPIKLIPNYKGPFPITDAVLNQAMLDKGDERAEILGGFKRRKAKGDGNCLFRAHSQAIASHQNLHIPLRQGTASLMRLHPERYMGLSTHVQYASRVTNTVDKSGSPVGTGAQQALADLIRARVTYIDATSSTLIQEVTPTEGKIYYEITIGTIPKHADTLGRDHMYEYHNED